MLFVVDMLYPVFIVLFVVDMFMVQVVSTPLFLDLRSCCQMTVAIY